MIEKTSDKIEKSIYLPIVFHFHQPVDNFPWVYEDCFQKSYGPLIDNIYKFPSVKFTLHFSGNLLEWFLQNKPDFINKLKEMARRGQIEIIGGGYYEPIFAIIPKRDRIAQMKKLSNLVKMEFGLEVKGAWLSERVWEPNYPSFLNKVGLNYVIVDDNHFRSCGLTQEETLYTYITEDEGKTLRVFPINEPLRYLTPWKPTYLSIDYLKKVADEKGDRVALLISDAEKMGVWGSTHLFCYVEGKGHEDGDNGKPFIPAFFEQIRKNKWIKSITLTEYVENFPARDIVYLPTASYDKMEEWVLPTKVRSKYKKIREQLQNDPQKQDEYQFLKGGFWRSFLVKYPESNNMHKKMLHVRDKVLEIETKVKELKEESKIIEIQKKMDIVWDEIYKSQCNDCYWHGMFGGIYLQFLRFSVYTHLINAEKIIDEINILINAELKNYIKLYPIDITRDSKEDYVIESDIFNLYFDLSDGGTIFELDFKPKSYNLLNTLTRWREAYHDTGETAEIDEKVDEKKEIKNDRYRRSMLRTRILHNDATLERFEKDIYYEFGDFVNGQFEVIKATINSLKAELVLQRRGSIKYLMSDERFPCTITKRIFVENDKLEIMIEGEVSQPPGKEKMFNETLSVLNLAIDIPFFFNGDPNKFQWSAEGVKFKDDEEKNLISAIEYKGTNMKSYDESYDLHFDIECSSNADGITVYKFPIIAYAYTDTGYREIYQGICATCKIKLAKKFSFQLKFNIH